MTTMSILDMSYPNKDPFRPPKLESSSTKLALKLLECDNESQHMQRDPERMPKRTVSPGLAVHFDEQESGHPVATKRRKSGKNIFALCDRDTCADLRSGLVQELTKKYERQAFGPDHYERRMSSIVCDESHARLRSFAGFLEYDIGIYWKVKNDKFIVWDFGPGASARRVGVRQGDILRSVDGVEILDFKVDEHGHHPIDDLILGKRGSYCNLSFLRVIETDPEVIKARNGDARLGEYTVTLRRTAYAHTLDLDALDDTHEFHLHRPASTEIDRASSAEPEDERLVGYI